MATTTSLPPAVLVVDAVNPRLPQPNLGQREVLQAIAQHQQQGPNSKLLALARDIVLHGLNPAELSIVMEFHDDPNRFVVLEGNRRLAAIRALENPEFLVDAVPASIVTAFRKLSKQYQEAPVYDIPCVQVVSRDESQHWIELRHAGELEGAGLVRWGAQERERFTARSAVVEPALRALDYLEDNGYLTAGEKAIVPIASWRRLIRSPDVRAKIGIETPGGQLKILAKEKDVANALTHIAKDLASGNTVTHDIYNQGDRLRYAQGLPKNIVVTPILKSGQGVDIGTDVPDSKPKQPRTRERPPRMKLVPSDCVLDVTDTRIHNIEKELRRLGLNEYTNAVSVLFRVFVELSADSYIDRASLNTPVNAKLSVKLRDVVNELASQSKLSLQQAKPVRRALQKDSFLAPSIILMNEYIHNQYMFPTPVDLRASWDSMQPFITAIWSP